MSQFPAKPNLGRVFRRIDSRLNTLERTVSGVYPSIDEIETTSGGAPAEGSITDFHLADLAVTHPKLANLAVQADKLAEGAVTETKIGDNSIATGKIKANAIVADKIAANAIVSDKIFAGAITTEKLAANSVTAEKIEAGAITAEKIFAESITAYHIGAYAITAGVIAAYAITTEKIAAGAVTANEIAANTIVAGNIDASAITTSELAADSVTSEKIVAGTIVASDIATDTLTANEIAANSITASELAANSITAADILANTITASQIAANTLTANEIAANAITASELAAGSVEAGKLATGAVQAGNVAAGAVQAGQLDAAAINGMTITGATVQTSSSGARVIMDTVGIRAYQTDGTTKVLEFKISDGSLSVLGEIKSGSSLPADIVGSTQIVPATIVTGDVANATLLAGNIAAGTITANEIAGTTITANKIAAGTITSNEINVSSIAAATVTATYLAGKTITGGLIQTSSGATTGIKLTTTSLKSYDGTNITYELDGSTGRVTVGDAHNGTNKRIEIDRTGMGLFGGAASGGTTVATRSPDLIWTSLTVDNQATTVGGAHVGTTSRGQITTSSDTTIGRMWLDNQGLHAQSKISNSTIQTPNLGTLNNITVNSGNPFRVFDFDPTNLFGIRLHSWNYVPGAAPNGSHIMDAMRIDPIQGVSFKLAEGGALVDNLASSWTRPSGTYAGKWAGRIIGDNFNGTDGGQITVESRAEATTAAGAIGSAVMQTRYFNSSGVATNLSASLQVSMFGDAATVDANARSSTGSAYTATLLNSSDQSSFARFKGGVSTHRINYGTSTVNIPAGASFATVNRNHGLGVTPSVVFVSVANYVNFMASAVPLDSTSYTITVSHKNSTAGAATINYDWLAIG